MAESLTEKVSRQMREMSRVEWADSLSGFIEVAAAFLDDAFGDALGQAVAVPGAGGLEAIYALYKGYIEQGGVEALPNPYFSANGIEGNVCARGSVKKYLKSRQRKQGWSKLISAGSAASSFATGGISIGETAQYTHSLASTGTHIYKLRAIASEKWRIGPKYRAIIDFLVKMKIVKAGMKAGQWIGAAVPCIPGGGLMAGVVVPLAALTTKVTWGKVAVAMSIDLHWRAFQEMQVMGGYGGAFQWKADQLGPAFRIISELFTVRGVTKAFWRYEVRDLVSDPIGWAAIYDKIMLF
jgi:hypothetical protein